MTQVLLVDDHALIRRGLRDALGDAGVQVAAEAACWDELAPLLDTTAFDVLLLDIHLPGRSGLEILELLKALPVPPRALVVSMYPEDPYALQALRAGAWGYVSKSSDTSVLVDAIGKVAAGRRHVSTAMASLLADRVASPVQGAAHERLSPREQQLLVLLARGLKLPDVAQHLDIQPKAVGVYRARLMEKMKRSSNAELTHYAQQHGLVAD